VTATLARTVPGAGAGWPGWAALIVWAALGLGFTAKLFSPPARAEGAWQPPTGS